MSGLVGVAAVAPVMAQPSVRSEQVTQLVMGETADLLESSNEWRRLRTHLDGYEGWVHHGYVRELPAGELAEWQRSASAFSQGARIATGREPVTAPLRARLALVDGLVALPDGRAGRVVEGVVREAEAVELTARAAAPAELALEHFAGSHYQWGGVTPLGVDCSGLVQTTWLMRGIRLPRDASEQAGAGSAVAPEAAAPGDLLFFTGDAGSAITHVAILAAGDTLVHSTIACGGVVHEPFGPGSRAGEVLRPRLSVVRRVVA